MMHSTSSVFGSGASSSSSSLDFVDDFNFSGDCVDGSNTSYVQTEKNARSKPNRHHQHILKKDSTGYKREIASKSVSFSNGDDFHHKARAVDFLSLDSTLSDYNDQPIDSSYYQHHEKVDDHLCQQQHSDSSYSLCLDPAHSTYSSFLSSCDSDIDDNSDQSKRHQNHHPYSINTLSPSLTTAAAAALKAVGTTAFTVASAAAGALSIISVRDGIEVVKPLLSNKKKINPLQYHDAPPVGYEDKTHLILQQPTQSAEDATETPSKRTETLRSLESTLSTPLTPRTAPSTPSLSITHKKAICFNSNMTANDDKNDYDRSDNKSVSQTAMPAFTPELPPSHDYKSTTIWINHDGQVLNQFDEESGRGYDIDVTVGNTEGTTESETIFASRPLIKEMKSERNRSGTTPAEQLNDDASTSSRQPAKEEQRATGITNRLYDAAHTSIESQPHYWWGGSK